MNAASLVSVLSLATLLCAAPAHAEPASEDPAAAGRAAYALGNYAAAATAFEEAFQRTPVPALLYNAAQSHRLAGNKQRALELYRNYVRVFGRKAKNYREAQHHVGALEKEIEREGDSHPVASPPPVAPTVPPPAPVQPAPLPHALSVAPPPPVVMVAAPPPEPERPFTRSPVFWTAVGVGVVLIAGGATALLMSRRSAQGPSPSLGTVPGN
jgi:tetratricopeptide (TPR) repeat protein